MAGLPSELEAEDQEAKRFDRMLVRLEIGVIKPNPCFAAVAR